MPAIRAIGALWLRDMRRYLRLRLQVALSLLPPTLFLLVLGFGMDRIFRASGEGSYFRFLVPGIVTMTVLYAAAYSAMSLLSDRKLGFTRALLVAPVPRLGIVLGQILGMSSAAILQGACIILVSLLAGYRPVHVGGIALAVVFMVLMAVVFTSWGLAFGAVLKDASGFQVVITFLIGPLFFFSGALYPLDDLPPLLAVLSRLDPTAYAVDGLRGALLGQARFGVWRDGAVLLLLVPPSILLATWRFNRMET